MTCTTMMMSSQGVVQWVISELENSERRELDHEINRVHKIVDNCSYSGQCQRSLLAFLFGGAVPSLIQMFLPSIGI